MKIKYLEARQKELQAERERLRKDTEGTTSEEWGNKVLCDKDNPDPNSIDCKAARLAETEEYLRALQNIETNFKDPKEKLGHLQTIVGNLGDSEASAAVGYAIQATTAAETLMTAALDISTNPLKPSLLFQVLLVFLAEVQSLILLQ